MKGYYTHQQAVTRTTSVGVETMIVQHDYIGAMPMLRVDRLIAYEQQNAGRPLTVRQERAIRKATKRAVWRGHRATAERLAA